MPFNPLIPQATDEIATSQSDILNNFGVLGAIAGNANASSASINNTSGFNWVYFSPQGAIPPSGAAFTAGNVALYSAMSSISMLNELWINKTINTGIGPVVTQIPATAAGISSTGWTYLPSAILMKWGIVTLGAAGPFTITFPAGATIPAFSAAFVVLVTPGFAGTAYVISLSATNFVIDVSAAGLFYWFVVGV